LPYIFIAKSAGSILALKSISKEVPKPTACLFLGLPIKFAERYDISLNDLLVKTDVPIIIAQNNNDPFGSYDEVKNIIDSLGNKNITVKKLEGDTHDYNNFAEISHILSNIINLFI
jgi:predicted alpha/beta-hydrolase family hydrolase